MKTKQLALISADPIGSFLQSLPRKASVLGFKLYRSAEQSAMLIRFLMFPN
jgi:hypothetical protein